MEWKNIHAETPEVGTYLVVIPSDGSGSRLFFAADGGNGNVDFVDVEYHDTEPLDGIFLDGASWTEAPAALIEPFFLRDQ